MKKIKMMKANIVVPYEKLHQKTKYSETLELTESRQYRMLLHVTDAFFQYMIRIEEARVKYLRISKCHRAGHKFLFEVKREILVDREFRLGRSLQNCLTLEKQVFPKELKS